VNGGFEHSGFVCFEIKTEISVVEKMILEILSCTMDWIKKRVRDIQQDIIIFY
jgi:hypothetical protein